MKPYYPTIHIQKHAATTFIRKKHRGKWYDIQVIETGLDAEKRIHEEAYKAILFYRVNLNAIHINGTKVHIPSELQISEEERLNLK